MAEIYDEVSVMYAGQVIETTTIDDLFDRPRHPYTEGVLDAIPDHRSQGTRLRAIPGAVPPPWLWPDSCHFQGRCRHAQDDVCGVGRSPCTSTATDPVFAVREATN